MPRIAPTRKPQAAEPKSQPTKIATTITAAVVPIRTEPAPARLSFGVGCGSICGASIAELVTTESRLLSGKTADFVRCDDGAARARSRLRRERRGDLGRAAPARRALRARRASTGPGFPPGPPVERVDFEADADWLAERLHPGDHLCGHSYGGVVCLLAAARYPELGSLTVIEPPATRVARGRSGGRRVRRRRDRALARRPARAGGVPAGVPSARSARPGSRPLRSRPTLERGRADPDGRARPVGGGDSARRAARAPVPEARRLGRRTTPPSTRSATRSSGSLRRSESSSPARVTQPSARPASTRRSSAFLARAETRLGRAALGRRGRASGAAPAS